MSNETEQVIDPVFENFRFKDHAKYSKSGDRWGIDGNFVLGEDITVKVGLFEAPERNNLLVYTYPYPPSWIVKKPFSVFIYNPEVTVRSLLPNRTEFDTEDFFLQRFDYSELGMVKDHHSLVYRPKQQEIIQPDIYFFNYRNRNSTIFGMFVSVASDLTSLPEIRQSDTIIGEMLIPAMETLATDRLRQKDSLGLPFSASPEQPSSGPFPWRH